MAFYIYLYIKARTLITAYSFYTLVDKTMAEDRSTIHMLIMLLLITILQ